MRGNKLLATMFVLVVILGSAFLYSQHQRKVQVDSLRSRLETKEQQTRNAQEKVAEIKAEKVAKYSKSVLNDNSKNAKSNIDKFFTALDQWSGNQWAKRIEKAKPYATEKALNNFTGGGQQSYSEIDKRASELQANHTTSLVTSTNWYTEKSNGEVVNGLYLIKSKVTVNDDAGTNNTQLFKISYDLSSGKITKISSIDFK